MIDDKNRFWLLLKRKPGMKTRTPVVIALLVCVCVVLAGGYLCRNCINNQQWQADVRVDGLVSTGTAFAGNHGNTLYVWNWYTSGNRPITVPIKGQIPLALCTGESIVCEGADNARELVAADYGGNIRA